MLKVSGRAAKLDGEYDDESDDDESGRSRGRILDRGASDIYT